MNKKPLLLIMADWFAPAYKAGGPVQSVVNFAEYAKTWYDIYVFTGDRDLGEERTLTGISTNTWILHSEGVRVYYASPDRRSYAIVKGLIRHLDPDYVYCNSMFSTAFAVFPMIIKRFSGFRAKLILAPRGMLKPSALEFKAAKKKVFLSIIQWLGIPRRITFHATDTTEESCIHLQFGKVDIVQAGNIPGVIPQNVEFLIKKPDFLSIIFIGRVHPVKNLKFLLEILNQVNGVIKLTIIGLLEDPVYVKDCRVLVDALPDRIQVDFTGELPHLQTREKLMQHHILASPTLGENFGHAIFEALSLGKPVLISDQTPWKNLFEKKAGWDFSLNKPMAFIEVLNILSAMGQEEYDAFSEGAFQFVKNYVASNDPMKTYFELFPLHEN